MNACPPRKRQFAPKLSPVQDAKDVSPRLRQVTQLPSGSRARRAYGVPGSSGWFGLDMLRLESHANEVCSRALGSGQGSRDAQQKCRFDGAGIVKDAVEDAVGEDLYALRVVDGAFAIVLDLSRCSGVSVPVRSGSVSMLAVATASCTAMLMPMPPTGDMAWAASPMQSRPGTRPAIETVDLDGEKLDLVP